MSKGGLAVSPFIAHAQALGAMHVSDLLAQSVESCRDGQLLNRFVALTLVHGHIKDTKVQLA